jgi:hypothetical protein
VGEAHTPVVCLLICSEWFGFTHFDLCCSNDGEVKALSEEEQTHFQKDPPHPVTLILPRYPLLIRIPWEITHLTKIHIRLICRHHSRAYALMPNDTETPL